MLGDHLAALHRRPRERAREQRDGGDQAAGAGAVRRARRRCTSTRPTTSRSRRMAGPASTRARRSSSSPTSASTRSRRPRKRRRTRSATCRSASSAASPSARSSTSIVGIVATGLVPYQQLKAADPLARALEVAGLTTASWIVAFGAVVSLTAVLLVFQYGQPRIFFAMARDGLLPAWAAKIHPKYRTPHVTTVFTGISSRWAPGRGRERNLRPDQHRHAVRVRDRLHRRARAALQGSESPAAVPGAVRLAGVPRSARGVRLRDDGLPARHGNGSASGWRSAFCCISSTGTAAAASARPVRPSSEPASARERW